MPTEVKLLLEHGRNTSTKSERKSLNLYKNALLVPYFTAKTINYVNNLEKQAADAY